MDNYEELLTKIDEQEKLLQFDRFSSEDALQLGLLIIDKAKKQNASITLDITRHGHQLFHYSFEGTSPDNDQWVFRKSKVVNRFNTSSLAVGIRLKLLGQTLEEKYNLSSFEYAPHGGSFPLIIRGAGVIGTITVSGLSQEEDHELVAEAIKEYLKL